MRGRGQVGAGRAGAGDVEDRGDDRLPPLELLALAGVGLAADDPGAPEVGVEAV